ncbi:MAG: DUF3021 domain-containing protein, partial [Oscillospiraceae bacterium]
IGYIISIVFSLIFADGYYSAVHPELAITFGSEINAVVVQTILWGLIGFLYSGFSVLWEKDNWSLFKQTVVVFLVYLLPMFIIGYILKWFAFSVLQVIIFILIFIIIFAVIWIFTYLKIKKDVNALNSKIKNQ